MWRESKGFSLIELMVALSVIVIIGTASFSAFRSSRKNSRDAKRTGDLTALQQAFEQYYAVNGIYTACTTMGTAFIQGEFPTDPSGGGDYAGVGACTANTYCVCAQLEIVGRGNSTVNDCTNFASGDWYCVQNQQ